MKAKRLIIIGAGSIGLEAALLAAANSLDFEVYEAGRVAENLRQWGHVRMFSPWRLNHSDLAVKWLKTEFPSLDLPDNDDLLTGQEMVERYYEPLSRLSPLKNRIHLHQRVLAISREQLLKKDLVVDR